MDRRYLFLGFLIILCIFIGTANAKWSIAEPTAENAAYIKSIEEKGYWNFEYDEAAPYTTAGMMCCWWERWYKWQKFSQWKGQQNTMNLGSSDSIDTKSYLPESQLVETKSFQTDSGESSSSDEEYCPSCCSTCDDDTPAELQARSDVIMAKKPWLTEGKNNQQSGSSSTSMVTPSPTMAQMVMIFSDAK